MRRALTLAAALTILAGTAWAADVADTPEQYLIFRPASPMLIIDGKLDEWDMARSPYVISDEKKIPTKHYRSGRPANPVGGDADLGGRVAVAWDETYLYVACRMTDDHLLGVYPHSAGNQGPPGFRCDSLMVVMASFSQPFRSNAAHRETPMLALRYAPTGKAPRGKLLRKRDLDNFDEYWKLTPGSHWGVAETPDGYNVEVAVPWKDLDYVARPGNRFFMAFLAADMDPGERLNQVGWGFALTPKHYPVFRLAERTDCIATLTSSVDELAPNQAWAIRAELDALAKPTTLAGVRVVDAAGKTVFQKKLSLAVPAGKRSETIVPVPADALKKVGDYRIEALVGPGDVVAALPVRVAVPRTEVAAVPRQPGALRPASPARFMTNAYSEHKAGAIRHGFVTGKAGYVAWLRKWVEPDLKQRAADALKRKRPSDYQLALECMALHQITGDEEYARLTRELMDVVLDRFHQPGNLSDSYMLQIIRFLTWKQDPKSPYAPANAEARYRKVYHRVAAKPVWTFFEHWSTDNHTWHRYAPIKIAQDIATEDKQPIDPQIPPFVDFHDKLILAMGDDDDASSNYHWVFMKQALAWFFHTGDWKGFAKHKGFRRTFDRYVEMHAPSGASPHFQHSRGWQNNGQAMWAFEMVSRATGNGRFRWTAHRLAEYEYNHLFDCVNDYSHALHMRREAFTLAYLLADEGVKPTPPKPVSRVTWRHPMRNAAEAELKAQLHLDPHLLSPEGWVPDRLILSGSNDGQSLWGLVELLNWGGHAGHIPGNIIGLVQHDAALMAGQGRMEQTPQYQNLLWIEDRDGLPPEPEMLSTDLPVFVDDPAFTFVRIRTERFQQLPVTTIRDLFFFKQGFLLVKDRVTFHKAMKVRVGPCYQTRCLGPQNGANWFNTYYDELLHSGGGSGRGGGMAIPNPAWDMLVYFVPRDGRTVGATYHGDQNPWRCSPVRMRQSWTGLVEKGRVLTFTSVLLPHAPIREPKTLLEPRPGTGAPKHIEVAVDRDDLTVVKVIAVPLPGKGKRATPYETWVMLNRTGKLATAGPLASDAAVAVIGLDPRGRVQTRAIVGGSTLRFRDKDEMRRATRHEPKPMTVPAALSD